MNGRRIAVRWGVGLLFGVMVCLEGVCGSWCWGAEVIAAGEGQVVGRCGRGALLEAGGQRVLLLAGSPYEMGYQQGWLLKADVRKLCETVLLVARAVDSQRQKDFFSGSIEKAFERTRKFIPERYLEEMQGLADGAEVPLEQVQWANIFPELFHCSGFALFGEATAGGDLLHGRILDYMTEIGLQDHAVVTVARPTGYHAFVTVGYAGFLGSVTGMNERQIAIGEMGGQGEGQWDGMPMTFLVRKALEEADTLEEAVSIFQTTPRTCEYYYVVSDGKVPDARGLACTPERCEVIGPGQFHERLPRPVKDAVLMSAGKRYNHLAGRVQEQFGRITAGEALDLMNRPIAMESCLHRVLFAPGAGELWVANSVSVNEPNYAACYQPYYAYEFGKLAALIPAEAPAGAGRIPAYQPAEPGSAGGKAGAAVEKAVTGPKIVTRDVPETVTRILPGSADPRQQALLAAYGGDDQAFGAEMEFRLETVGYQVYEVRFPSAYVSTIAENNTVYCEYYCRGGNQVRAAVILLDILDGSMTISRLVAHTLANSGIDACIVVLPHYGPRRSRDGQELRGFMENPERLVLSVEQAVMDVRRTARWLASRESVDAERIGLCGTSLGGFIAALAAGVDGGFGRVALLLAGGDLAGVVSTEAKEVRRIRQELQERNISIEQLREILAPIEPLNFADRLRGTKVLMVNGSIDPIVPAECARKLAAKAQTEIRWFETDHYGMVKYLWPTLEMVLEHFSGETW